MEFDEQTKHRYQKYFEMSDEELIAAKNAIEAELESDQEIYDNSTGLRKSAAYKDIYDNEELLKFLEQLFDSRGIAFSGGRSNS